jgi:RNA polymerase-binding transcription factor DksA
MTFTPHPRRDRSEVALEAALRRLELDTAISALMTGALERIINGTYGKCARCPATIAPERLRALPWVRMCANCQDADLLSAEKTIRGGKKRCNENPGA